MTPAESAELARRLGCNRARQLLQHLRDAERERLTGELQIELHLHRGHVGKRSRLRRIWELDDDQRAGGVDERPDAD